MWKNTYSVESYIAAPPASHVHCFVLNWTFYTVGFLFAQWRFTVWDLQVASLFWLTCKTMTSGGEIEFRLCFFN